MLNQQFVEGFITWSNNNVFSIIFKLNPMIMQKIARLLDEKSLALHWSWSNIRFVILPSQDYDKRWNDQVLDNSIISPHLTQFDTSITRSRLSLTLINAKRLIRALKRFPHQRERGKKTWQFLMCDQIFRFV